MTNQAERKELLRKLIINDSSIIRRIEIIEADNKARENTKKIAIESSTDFIDKAMANDKVQNLAHCR